MTKTFSFFRVFTSNHLVDFPLWFYIWCKFTCIIDVLFHVAPRNHICLFNKTCLFSVLFYFTRTNFIFVFNIIYLIYCKILRDVIFVVILYSWKLFGNSWLRQQISNQIVSMEVFFSNRSFVLTRKMDFLVIMLYWNHPFQFCPVDLEFSITPMITYLIEITLYDILWFLFFLIKRGFSNRGGGVQNFFHVPLSSNIGLNQLPFYL